MLKSIGPLRGMLDLTALLFALLLPFAHLPGYESSWNLFFSGVLPACAPIVVIVIMLDVMMSQIWKSDASAERIAALNTIIKVHCVVAALLLMSFLTVFLPVLVP
jgi:hypothetical protein|tara:strand:- start:376 stop:690 length:315 start_codon:yes stop_codon:yes gene_type:complete